MRPLLAKLLYEWMKENSDVYVITADLGFKYWDKIKKDFPSRWRSVGASEQLMVGAGIGLALAGKIPVLYSITPFILWRPYELIRNYIDFEKIPVKLIGCGFENDYQHDGFSHFGDPLRHQFKNINYYIPMIELELENDFTKFKNKDKPSFLCVRR
jgi:transketolase